MKQIITLNYRLLLSLIFIFSFTNQALASHNDRYDSIDREDLDEDVVEEFKIPILFGVTLSDLTPDFGAPRGGGTRSHEGQDFITIKGAPIISPTEAIVLSTGTGESAGKYVYTANPGGETFRYMHLDTIAKIKRGDKLKVGDIIGTVGDTGNAPDGVYHLHFEVRDEKNNPTDPYLRLSDKEFTLKDKMKFVTAMMDNVDDEDEYSEFLVTNFAEDFSAAVQAGYTLPSEIKSALKETGVDDKLDLLSKLQAVIKTIPAVLTPGIKEGDSSVAVSLLQTFLIYNSDGQAHSKLALAGPTGYFGPVTTAALLEYQSKNDLSETGVFDTKTKSLMSK